MSPVLVGGFLTSGPPGRSLEEVPNAAERGFQDGYSFQNSRSRRFLEGPWDVFLGNCESACRQSVPCLTPYHTVSPLRVDSAVCSLSSLILA